MLKAWTWKTGTPRERADTVRGHVSACLNNHGKLRELFNLTEAGLCEILSGSDWRPEHRDHSEDLRSSPLATQI